MKKIYKIFFLFYLVCFSQACLPVEYFHNDDLKLVKRLHLNPFNENEVDVEKAEVIFRLNLEKDYPSIYPVLQILHRDQKKLDNMINAPTALTYFTYIYENEQGEKKFRIFEHSERIERQYGPPFRFVTDYKVDEIPENKEEIDLETLKELREMLHSSYEEENKVIKDIQIKFRTDWVFDWQIIIVTVNLESGKSETISVVNSKFIPDETKRRNLRYVNKPIGPVIQPKISISHCLDEIEYHLRGH